MVKGSTAGYLRAVYESGAELGPSAFESDLKAQARDAAEAGRREEAERKRRERAEADATERAKRSALALPPEERLGLAREWQQTEAGRQAAWSDEKGDFKATTDRIGFGLWLRKRLSA